SRLVGGLGSRTEVVDAARGLSLLSQGASVDPHVWLDPTAAPGQTQTIAEGLTRADPAGAPVYRANAAKLAARLDALDQAFAAGLRDCAPHELGTSPAALAYLARRCGRAGAGLLAPRVLFPRPARRPDQAPGHGDPPRAGAEPGRSRRDRADRA